MVQAGGLAFSYPTATYEQQHAIVRGAWDADLLRLCKADFQDFKHWTDKGSKRSCGDWQYLPPSVTRVIQEASSPRFIKWLEELTREDGLIPDPYLKGGGMHQIPVGQSLGMHVDFNWHDRMRLYRRLNLLLYLNEHWRPTWGGALVLKDRDILPELNTMVVFATDDDSWHGHPEPAKEVRDSIALYYYSAIRPADYKRRDVTLYA